MITTDELNTLVLQCLEGRDAFIVNIEITNDKSIVVELDSKDGLDMELCATISRTISNHYGEQLDDYNLEVGSCGLTSPLRIPQQYIYCISRDVEVLTKDGKKLKGTISAANDEGFTLITTIMVKPEGAKRKEPQEQSTTYRYTDVKWVKRVIEI